jgi:Enoyl-(Acyl carrier protein) reductase
MVQDVIDIDLAGLWKTTTAAVPAMIDARRGGSIILTSSVTGLIAFPNLTHYNAAKHGVVGLMKSLAIELAPHRIRANYARARPRTPVNETVRGCDSGVKADLDGLLGGLVQDSDTVGQRVALVRGHRGFVHVLDPSRSEHARQRQRDVVARGVRGDR